MMSGLLFHLFFGWFCFGLFLMFYLVLPSLFLYKNSSLRRRAWFVLHFHWNRRFCFCSIHKRNKNKADDYDYTNDSFHCCSAPDPKIFIFVRLKEFLRYVAVPGFSCGSIGVNVSALAPSTNGTKIKQTSNTKRNIRFIAVQLLSFSY